MMRKHVFPVLVILTVTTVCLIAGWQHTASTIADKSYLIVNLAIAGLIVVVGSSVSLLAWWRNWRPARNYSLLVTTCAVTVGMIPLTIQNQRVRETEQELTSLHDRLAGNGPPFPSAEQLDWRPDHPALLVSHGYWVANDLQTFEVYYHLGSDSRTLAYPRGQWEWRGFNYQGPTEPTQ